jgi:hypothetical protein
VPAYTYTDWEDYSYSLDLGEIIDAQTSGAAPDDSICQFRTVQLEATTFIGPIPFEVSTPELAREVESISTGVSGDGNLVAAMALRHSAYGDGITLTPWWDVSFNWIASTTYDTSIGQHAGYPSGGSVSGEPFVTLDEPTRTMTSDTTQDIAITWTLSGGDPVYGGLDDEQPFGLPTYYRWALRCTMEYTADDGTTGLYSPRLVYPEDLGTTWTGLYGPGRVYYVAVQWIFTSGGLDITWPGSNFKDGVGVGQVAGQVITDPGVDSPALTTLGLRGFMAPDTWGDETHHEGTTVIVGNSTKTITDTEIPDTPGLDDGYWRVDSYESNSYQGYWTVQAGDDPTAHLDALVHRPPTTDTDIQHTYGPYAVYDYDYDGLTDIGITVGAVQVTDDGESAFFPNHAEIRAAVFAAPDDLKVWLTPDDLAAIDTTDLVEGTAADGVALHITTVHAREYDGSWFYGAKRAGIERGGRFYSYIAGAVTISGRRRVKYVGIIPPLQQNQRLSLVSGHGAQATASPPRLRAQGDL